MEEADLLKRLEAQEAKLESIQASVEKTRKYMLWGFIMQLAVVLLPLIVLMFAVPFIFSSLSGISNAYEGLR
jgi:hypothetical protein